jgi:predicted DCC family thiol-disulfide oxidoreductase YuxK
MRKVSPEPSIVLFDGVCNLCDAAVQFVLDRDARGRFVFAALQSDEGRRLLAKVGAAPSVAEGDPDSIVLVEGGRAYERSDAILRIARGLGAPWSLAVVFLAVPRFVRDALYRFIARRRYRWFGKKASCRVPTPALRERFLENRPELL